MATNTLLTNDIILKEAMMHLENELVVSKLATRDFESSFGGPRKAGETIRLARPIRGQTRTGATMVAQDITEGRETLAVTNQLGADLEFTSRDLTLSVDDFSERILKPQMIAIANTLDIAVMTELMNKCPNWVGTPGQTVNSFADFALAPKRLDDLSVPRAGRVAILNTDDHWGLLGSVTSLSADAPVKSALESAAIATPYAGVKLYMSQNVISHTNGTWSSVATMAEINNGTLSVSYATAKDTWTMDITVDGLTTTTGTALVGDVITIENVYAVNTLTGATLPWLREFVVRDAETADASGNAVITISPPIITSGPYKTCNAAAVNDANIVLKGSINVAYGQSIVFHPDAIALAIPPMHKPQGAAWCETRSYKGINLRLVQGYDIVNDLPQWRFDMLYGVKAHQPWLATRLSGS
jgi:hypothetical protein